MSYLKLLEWSKYLVRFNGIHADVEGTAIVNQCQIESCMGSINDHPMRSLFVGEAEKSSERISTQSLSSVSSTTTVSEGAVNSYHARTP
jgi:hypothetical protein